MLNIALPKGRLGEKVYRRFARVGYACPELEKENRKLVFDTPDGRARFFLVKPSDVPIYVERGAADIGVAGKDVLLESEADVYELADLRAGVCRLAVCGPEAFRDRPDAPLRVGTKYPRVARRYFYGQEREIEIIRLNGSIELAPIVGLSDVIVDIVETGATLRENNLCVLAEIAPVSARLIANRSSYAFARETIDALSVEMTREDCQ